MQPERGNRVDAGRRAVRAMGQLNALGRRWLLNVAEAHLGDGSSNFGLRRVCRAAVMELAEQTADNVGGSDGGGGKGATSDGGRSGVGSDRSYCDGEDGCNTHDGGGDMVTC